MPIDKPYRPELPPWMQNNNTSCQEPSRNRGKHSGFIKKTINEIKKVMVDDRTSEYFSRQPGLLQAVDPRVKLLAVLALIITAGITRSLYILLILELTGAVMMMISRLPFTKLQLRIWGFIPMLTLLAAVPGMFNIFNDGTPLLVFYENRDVFFMGFQLPQTLFISLQGFKAALFLFLRVGISLSLGLTLILTTPLDRLLKSLRVIGVPTIFIMIIEMTYRYIILLLGLSLDLFEARKVRTVGELSSSARRLLFGSSLAVLFSRSTMLAEEVYQAMTARGYTGEAVTIEEMNLGNIDLLFSMCIIVLTTSLVIGGRFIG